MKSTTKLMVLAILVTFCSYGRAAEDEEIKQLQKDLQKGKFFIASKITTTFTAISIFTSARPFHCLITVSTNTACTGRRKLRRKRRLNISVDNSADALGLEMSEGKATPEQLTSDDLDSRDKEKFLFTVWQTTTTTATVTSFSTNMSITLSVSASCTYPAMTTVPGCG